MSFSFRDTPRLGDRLRGKTGVDLLREIKQRLNDGNDTLFEPSHARIAREPFERHPSTFPRGFPFDDEDDDTLGRRGDGIRAHLDDLAARHPEFEHLLGPSWNYAPAFHDSPSRDVRQHHRQRRRRRDSGGSGGGGSSGSYQGHVDEDARSQASGSSAASGASAVSSHSSGGGGSEATALPQYGLRNTVDIGQQQRRGGMENHPEISRGERGLRSMSAPPENRQQANEQQQMPAARQQPPVGPGQRFVSRVDITPQHNQQQRAQSPKLPASNVRHIPIFVEGRDEPVLPKLAENASSASSSSSSTYQHQPSPPPPPAPSSSSSSSSSPLSSTAATSSSQHQQHPPHFHRPSHFNDHFTRQQWPPQHFQNAFYEPAGFEQPSAWRHHHQPQYCQPQYYQQRHQEPQYHQQRHQEPPQCHQQRQQEPQQPQQQQPQQQQQQQQQQQPQQQQEVPKPKIVLPKDPLEKVAQVQKEVDELAEQVQRYAGSTRQDKDYMYLDEMLTRQLIKLDDIETEGRENVRQARRNAIKSIQDTIGLLETKAPLGGGQPEQSRDEQVAEEKERGRKDDQPEETARLVPMESRPDKQLDERPSNEPIPLPPAPSSPTKTKECTESKDATVAESASDDVAAAERNDGDAEKIGATEMAQHGLPVADESSARRAMRETAEGSTENGTETAPSPKDAADGQRTESPRMQKKVKKTKKQPPTPVSEQAIPLPPPPEAAK